MYKLKDEPYSFGIKNISHREFNETPNIKRQVLRLIDENNVRGSLLENKEKYRESLSNASNNDHGTTDISSGTMDILPELTKEHRASDARNWESDIESDESFDDIVEVREGFKCKKSAGLRFIDSIFSIIVIIIFIIFLGYMIWISCFDRWNNEANNSPQIQETVILEPTEVDITFD